MAKPIDVSLEKPIELQEGYYLDNFLRVLSFIESTYSDILAVADLKFIENFLALSRNAQCLYIRLALRSKNIFRTDKLNYPEILINDAIAELNEHKFLQISPDLYFEDYISVFTVSELKELAKELGIKKLKSSRQLIIDALEESDEELFSYIKVNFKLILVLKAEVVEKLIFLFFGNLYEDMSHFILEDLGVRRYEKIQIDEKSRLFKSKGHVRTSFELETLYSDLWMAVEQEEEDLIDELVSRLEEIRCPKALKKKWSKSINFAARFYERTGEIERALFLYDKSSIAPARERMVRILAKCGEVKKAKKLCEKIEKSPFSADELLFAEFFKEGLKRKLGLEYVRRRKNILHEETILPLKWDSEGRVETQVLNYLKCREETQGFFSENVYWCGLSVLIFWQEFWESAEGVFYHPFESSPRDLLSGEFYMRQRDALEAKSSYWRKNEVIFKNKVLDLFDEKKGTFCELINWKKFERGNLELLLENTPLEVCLRITTQILKEPREYKSGLPDLFLITKTGFILGEVKSPNDQIQKSQKRWFKFFSENDIPYSIYRVAK